MTPTEADRVIDGIRARLPRLTWEPVVWADFRAMMLKIRIDSEQGLACVSSVVMTIKGIPMPAHFIDAFKAAQGEGSRQLAEEPRKELPYHPRVGAAIAGWWWAWKQGNWEAVVDSLPVFRRKYGWLPDWEAVIDPLRAGEFSHEQCEQLGLWFDGLRGPRAVKPRRGDDWWASQREVQASKVAAVAKLRKRVQGATA